MPTSRALTKQMVATYAEVLFEAASAGSSVDAVGGQLREAVATIRGHVALRDALFGDAVPALQRGNIAREVFSAMDPALSSALGVMAERGEAMLLPSVADAYDVLVEQRNDQVTAEVTTVIELTDQLREAIRTKLAADFGKTVVLREKVDPSIIGGIIISTHGKRLDASIASQLEAARATLSTAPTGGDV